MRLCQLYGDTDAMSFFRFAYRSKIFQAFLGVLGIGGSLYTLYRFGHWKELRWPGLRLLLIPVLMMLMEMAARAQRMKIICRYMGRPLSFREAVCINSMGDIYGAATPSGIGGEVSRIAVLNRLGVKGKNAVMALAADRFALILTLVPILGLGAAFFLKQDNHFLFSKNLIYTLCLYLLLAAGLISLCLILIRKSHKQLGSNWRKIFFHPSIFALASLHHINRIGLLPLMFWLFTGKFPETSVFIWSFILSYGVALIPLPSGGGGVEITFIALFGSLLGKIEAGNLLLWWRIAGHYLFVITSLITMSFVFFKLSRSSRNKTAENIDIDRIKDDVTGHSDIQTAAIERS